MAVERLTAIGWGLTMFAIVLGLGLVVLTKFGDTTVICGPVGTGTDVAATVWNATTQLCANASGSTVAGRGAGYNTLSYVVTQMGTTGLAGWIPVIIVVLIAGLVLALFGGKGKNY